MKTLDLREAITDALASLEAHGETASTSAVLESLGVVTAPTLRPSAQEPAPRDEPDADAPVSLGRFQLLGELGRGGMGRVLEARDPELRRSVAVKVVVDPTKVTAAQLSRFVAEAQVTSQLEHPNIVPVYDMGLSEDGQLYFVMRKVEGRSLRRVLTALRAGDEATAAEWTRTKLLHAFIQVCNAAAYAHDRGVLHRDLKPDNIMLGPFGEVLLVDWGVARLVGDTTEVVSSVPIERLTVTRTMDGAAIGTPGFMSPEQSQGNLHLLDARSDVWSLGAVLYEVLTLHRAYTAPNIYTLMHRTMSGPPMDPRERAPERGIPEEMAAVCLRAMAKEREDRFASASGLASAVEVFLEGSKRRQQARQLVAQAEALLPDIAALEARAAALDAEAEALLADVQGWEPEERKQPGWAKADEAKALRREAERMDLQHEQGLQSALRLAPSLPEAHAALAEHHRCAHEQAEQARDSDASVREDHLLRAHAEALPEDHAVRRRCAVYIKGDGALTLVTDPPGAEVLLHRYELHNRRLVPKLVRGLGRTPLARVSLPMGSYLCVLRSDGRPDVRYPVHIGRGAHWDGVPPEGVEPQPIRLPEPDDLGADDCYVPGGWFTAGGDTEALDALSRRRVWVDGLSLSRLPVTNRDYIAFLDDLVAQGREDEALRHAPRVRAGTVGAQGPLIYGYEGGRFCLRPDAEGDVWLPDWPVCMVDWHGAVALAAWQAARSGQAWRLPLELEWEKGARGVDGRFFPWGDDFDPSWCHMKDSHRGRRLPAAVGSYPVDESVYGVRDLAGNMRDWTGTAYQADGDVGDGDSLVPGQGAGEAGSDRVGRGGCWDYGAGYARVAGRGNYAPVYRYYSLGFRLSRTIP